MRHKRPRVSRDARSDAAVAHANEITERYKRLRHLFTLEALIRRTQEVADTWAVAADALEEAGEHAEALAARTRSRVYRRRQRLKEADVRRAEKAKKKAAELRVSRTKRLYRVHRRLGRTAQEAYRLAATQRGERIVGSVGDVNWPSYSGGPIVKDEVGNYALEWIEPPEETERRFTVYRVDLDRESLPGWINAVAVMQGEGGPSVLRRRWRSRDPKTRASARWMVGSYYGWNDLDSYPLRLTRRQIEERYRRKVRFQ